LVAKKQWETTKSKQKQKTQLLRPRNEMKRSDYAGVTEELAAEASAAT